MGRPVGRAPLPARRSIRLPDCDYASECTYFVTLCAHAREDLFGAVAGEAVVLTPLGQIVEQEWMASAHLRSEVYLDDYVVMPNHLHGIVSIVPGPAGDRRSPLQEDAARGPAARSLGALIAGFKASVTKRARAMTGDAGLAVWQRGYYEHVVRDDDDLAGIRHYIRDNPARCGSDPEGRWE